MGIKLDWEVESDAGWDEIGEDPQVIARRRNLRRNIRLLLALLAALLVGGSISIALRLRQVRGQLISTLEQTVAAETLALRLGDEAAFMRGQANISRWRRHQEEVFDDYQAAAPELIPGGEIMELDVEGSDARVVLTETIDGEPYQVVWFYHHDDTGWYHVSDVPGYWGEQHHTISAYADIAHVPPDDLYAETLAARIDAVMTRICALNVCGPDLPRIALHIDPDAMAQVHWDGEVDPVLVIPSPQQTRQPVNQPAEEVSEDVILRWLVTWWSTQVLGGPNERPIDKWLEAHLDLWLNHQLDPAWNSSGFFEPLEQTYDPDFVSHFVLRMQSGRDIIPAFSETIAGASTSPLEEESLEAQLTGNLRFEFAARSAGYHIVAQDLFVYEAGGSSDEGITSRPFYNASLDTLEVINTRQVGDLVWAELIFRPEEGWYTQLQGMLMGAVPFRQVGDEWQRVEPTLEDWGDRHTTRTEGLQITYYDLDQLYAEQVQTFLATEAYPQVVADFGLAPRDLVVLMTADPVEYEAFIQSDVTLSVDTLTVVMPSPYLYVLRIDDSVEDAVQRMAAASLLYAVFDAQTGQRVYDPIPVALIDWEMDRLGLEYWDFYQDALGPDDQLALNHLELDDLLGNDETTLSSRFALEHAAAQMLVDVITELYGDEIVVELMHNLPEAVSTSDWLMRSGVDPRAFESEWRARVALLLTTPGD